MTDKATAEDLEDSAQNSKRALRNLTNHLDARKGSIENQVAEGLSLVDSIAASLKEQESKVQKTSMNSRPSEAVKTAAEEKVKKVRRQLDQNLDKLQEAFASCESSSAAQAKARAIAADTHEGFKQVVDATLEANLDCVTTRKALQDSQQLMNWTLEILVEGSDALGQEKKNEFIRSADQVLRQMSDISEHVKDKTRDKRSLDDVRKQMKSLLDNVGSIKNESCKQGVSKEDALDKLSNSKEMIQDLLYNIKEAYSKGKKAEAEEQVKLLTDAMKVFDNALRAFASTEGDPAKRNRLMEGARELMSQTNGLIDLTDAFDVSSKDHQKEGEIKCDDIEDTLLDIVKPLQDAAEDEKILKVFMKQAKKVTKSADNLQEDPDSKNLDQLKKDVEKMTQCLEILSKMETNPEMKAKIDAKIAELNAALEALKKDMTPPIDVKKQAQSIENLKEKTNSAYELVGQSLMMKQLAEASQRAIDRANKNLNKNTTTITGDLQKHRSNARFKEAVEEAAAKVKEYEENPNLLLARSDMNRQMIQLAKIAPDHVPKEFTEAFVSLEGTIRSCKPFTRTLDIDASDLRVKQLQENLDKLLPIVRKGEHYPLFGLSLQDAGTNLKFARDEVNLCLDQFNEAIQRGNLEVVNSESVPLAESLESFFKAAKEAASTVADKMQKRRSCGTPMRSLKAQERVSVVLMTMFSKTLRTSNVLHI